MIKIQQDNKCKVFKECTLEGIFGWSLPCSLPEYIRANFRKYHLFDYFLITSVDGSFCLRDWKCFAESGANACSLTSESERQMYRFYFLKEIVSNISLNDLLAGEMHISFRDTTVIALQRLQNGGKSWAELADERQESYDRHNNPRL